MNRDCSGCGSSWATMARPIAMMAATMPSIRSVNLSLAGLDCFARRPFYSTRTVSNSASVARSGVVNLQGNRIRDL